MERISKAQLSSALTRTLPPSTKHLPDAELSELGTLAVQMAQRYPHQNLTDTLEGYLEDFEALAVKYSLRSVKEALRTLRIHPEQKFFPRPDEVAAEIERQKGAALAASSGRQSQTLLGEMDRQFWEWVDCRLLDADTVSMSEQQFLDTVKIPGWTGRKARLHG